MTRDSNGWWWVMGGAIVTALVSDMTVVNDIVPDSWEKSVHAVIKLLSVVIAAGAGLARMSPLPISPEGRVDAMQRKGEQMGVAAVAATVASVKADVAVKATSDAAEAANIAKDVSEKAGDL
jgi:hypothetical protein